MSTELERELERLLRAPEPGSAREEEALQRALAALPAPEPRRPRRLRSLLFVAAAVVLLLGVTAGALAAAGALRVTLGDRPAATRPEASTVSRLLLPGSAKAIAAVIDGRLWLTARNGVRIERLPVQSASLSPRALYVAAGIGDALVAMAPDGRRAWSHQTAGPVVAIGWAPDGLRIAYIVKHDRSYELRAIEGNGAHDTSLDSHVRAVAPSWRADSLAVSYVSAGGLPVIFDFSHDTHHPIAIPSARGAVQLAFAPTGATLAIRGEKRVVVLATSPLGRAQIVPAPSPGPFSWLGNKLAVIAKPRRGRPNQTAVNLFRVTPDGGAVADGTLTIDGKAKTIASSDRELVAAATGSQAPTRVLSTSPNSPTATSSQPAPTTLLTLPPNADVQTLDVR